MWLWQIRVLGVAVDEEGLELEGGLFDVGVLFGEGAAQVGDVACEGGGFVDGAFEGFDGVEGLLELGGALGEERFELPDFLGEVFLGFGEAVHWS